ncbi:MAG: hypothetical protein ACR2QH_10485, partial [Geminicoccaceae bacterium]
GFRSLSPEDQAAVAPQLQAARFDPRMQTVLGMTNEVAKMQVDIKLEVVPDTVNLQQEEFLALAEMARSGVPIPPALLIEASSIRNKKQLREILEGTPEQQQAAAQEEETVKQLTLAREKAGIRKTEAEAMDEIASAEQRMAETRVIPFKNRGQ